MKLLYDVDRNQLVEAGLPSIGSEEAEGRFHHFQMMRAKYNYSINRDAKSNRTLFLSIRGACGMACKYCFVKEKVSEVLPLEAVEKFLQENPVKFVQIFGGDLLDDPKYAEKLLTILVAAKVRNLMVSTGGRRLHDAIQMLEGFQGSFERFQFQISYEPREWAQRVDHSGAHIQDILEKSGALCRLPLRPSIRVVLPKGQVSAPTYLGLVGGLAGLRGSMDFALSFSVETNEDHQAFGDSFPEWERQSSERIEDKAFQNKLLYGAVWEGFASSLYRLGCGTSGDVSIGPDGKEYACHHNAVDKNQEFRKDDKARHSQHVLEWSKNLAHEECKTCVARYACGGVCHLQKVGDKNSACQFYRRAMTGEDLLRYTASTGRLVKKVMELRDNVIEPIARESYDKWLASETLEDAEEATASIKSPVTLIQS